jgi:1,4-dihydroxy-2-naphthoate octaprenyltransferase
MRIVSMRPATVPTIGTFRALVLMARPSQLALVILVFAAGALLAAWRGTTSVTGPVDPWAITTGLTLLLAATLAVHWANEAADAATDARSRRTAFSGGSGALAAGGLSPDLPLRLALGSACVTGVAAVSVAVAGAIAQAALLLLLAGLAGGLAYSLPPIAAMRRGLGEPLNALLGGLVLPLYGVAVVAGDVEPRDVLAFLPFTCVALGSVLATAWPDREADAATGKRTLQVRLPVLWLRRLHAVAMAGWLVATLAVITIGALPFPAAGLLVAPLLLLGHAWYTSDRSPWPSVAAMVGSIGITTIGLLVALA